MCYLEVADSSTINGALFSPHEMFIVSKTSGDETGYDFLIGAIEGKVQGELIIQTDRTNEWLLSVYRLACYDYLVIHQQACK